MKKLAPLILLVLPFLAFAGFWDFLGGGSGTITQLDFWKATSTPNVGITPRTYGQNIVLGGLSSGLLQVDSNGLVTGGGVGSSWATTSTDYWKTQNNFFSTTSTDYWLTQQTLGNQTPWTSNIDGGAYSLLNVGKIGIGTTTPALGLDLFGATMADNGISITSTVGDGFNIWNSGGSLSFGSDEQIAAGMSKMIYIEGQTGGDLDLGVDSAYTGVITIGNGDSSPLYLDKLDVQVTGTTTMSALNLNGADTGILFQDGTYQKTAATSPDLSPYQLISSAWSTTSTNYWATTYAGAFTASGITTNGTASSTSLVVSNTSLAVGKGRLYDIIALDRASIADATTTDATAYPFGSNLRQGGTAFTITQVDAVIASTTFRGAQNTQGMSWNIHIANVPASSSPMHLFTSDVNTNSTSTIQSYTPTGTATIPAGYNWAFVPSSASSSQIGMFQYVIWGYYQ